MFVVGDPRVIQLDPPEKLLGLGVNFVEMKFCWLSLPLHTLLETSRMNIELPWFDEACELKSTIRDDYVCHVL